MVNMEFKLSRLESISEEERAFQGKWPASGQ
jgi:hypothetical protein